jgi:hypothetical protein
MDLVLKEIYYYTYIYFKDNNNLNNLLVISC